MEEFELEPGESIILTVRRHWLLFVIGLLPFAILAILPVALMSFITHIPGVTLPSGSSAYLIQAALGVWWLFTWTAAFNTFTRYFLNQWIITTTRIVDIHQYSFFDRQVSSFLLDRVQDVTSNVDGFIATLCGFGNINVETAGRDEKFTMDGLQNPEGIRDLIMREVADLRETHPPSSTGV